MVSLWPFKGEASASDFEKTLSTLATKIKKTGARNDVLRHRARKIKVVWSLYTTFAYLITALILTLVTGWRNWTALEVTGLAGGPVVIFVVRKALTLYYDYRIRNTQEYLDSLYKERDATIEKLKTATKYDSTQQLLEKYGSSQPSPKKESSSGKTQNTQGNPQQNPQQQQQQPRRTNIAPPPTANIARGPPPPPTANIARPPAINGPSPPSSPQQATLPPHLRGVPSPTAEFAPNAYTAPVQYSQEPQWYDRILDVLLGEDENKAQNRMALLCEHCRLVNGLAPPGIKRLEDLGRWKCSGCGGWNGQEDEAKKLVEQIVQVPRSERRGTVGATDEKGIETEVAQEEAEPTRLSPTSSRSSSPELVDVDKSTPAQATRSRKKK